MLCRYSQVSKDGQYQKTKGTSSKLHYATMMFTRGAMVRSAGGILARSDVGPARQPVRDSSANLPRGVPRSRNATALLNFPACFATGLLLRDARGVVSFLDRLLISMTSPYSLVQMNEPAPDRQRARSGPAAGLSSSRLAFRGTAGVSSNQ